MPYYAKSFARSLLGATFASGRKTFCLSSFYVLRVLIVGLRSWLTETKTVVSDRDGLARVWKGLLDIRRYGGGCA
jgi:hypothetical protein